MKTASYHHGNLREALVSDAIRVIEKHGIEKVNLRDLSGSAGVSRTAPYRHFRSKAHLLSAVAARGFVILMNSCLASREVDPEKRLYDICRQYLNFANSYPGLYSLMFSPLLLSDEPTAELKQAADKSFGVFYEALCNLLGNQSAKHASGTVWSTVHGLAVLTNQKLLTVGNDGESSHSLISGSCKSPWNDLSQTTEFSLNVLINGLRKHREKA